MPQPWQGGMSVAPWCTVNVVGGNMLTAIPVVSWSGVGPSIEFTLYYNSYRADSSTQWRHSYSMRAVPKSVALPPPGYQWWHSMVVERSDGREDQYNWDGAKYVGPLGVWDTLEGPLPGGGFRLTTKGQWKYEFGDLSVNRGLVSITDPSGNVLTLAYVNGRIDTITDASGRQLKLEYLPACNETLPQCSQLCRVIDVDQTAQFPDDTAREWELLYDGECRLAYFQDSIDKLIGFGYDPDRHITSLTDKDNNTWAFAYDSAGRIQSVQDPGTGAATQEFVLDSLGATERRLTYWDRSGQPWKFIALQTSRTLVRTIDPLNFKRYLKWDGNRTLLAFTDQLGSAADDPSHTWTYTHDAIGNRLSATNPLGQTTRWKYDALNNLITVTPPLDNAGNPDLDKQVLIYYEDPLNPTSATRVREPADGQGNPAADTLLAYYDADDAATECTSAPARWKGLLKSVTDPNGVITTYTYDCTGQQKTETEGSAQFTGYRAWSRFDGGSRIFQAGLGPLPGGGSQSPPPECCWPQTWVFNDGEGRTQSVQCGVCTCIPPPNPGNPFLAVPTCAPPTPGTLRAGCMTATWTGMSQPQTVTSCVDDPSIGAGGQSYTRNHDFDFDEMGVQTAQMVTTDEPTKDGGGPTFERPFGYDTDFVNRTWDRTGPDGNATHVTADVRGLTNYVVRTGGYDDMEATVTYAPDRRVDTLTYGNGTRTRYTYDNARRLSGLFHERGCAGLWSPMLSLEYVYSADGLIVQITETDHGLTCGLTPVVDVITFGYDRRNRLIQETRTGLEGYDISYTYDPGGNRLTKTRGASTTFYTYDVQNPSAYGSHNNRLMAYEVVNNGQVISQAAYEYDARGNPTRITRHVPGTTLYTANLLYYDSAGRLWLVFDEMWQVQGEQAVNCERSACREYRYDLSGRRRYLTRTRDPLTLQPNNDAVWRDYDGDEIYADFSASWTGSAVSIANLKAHDPGLWQRTGTSEFSFFHGDQIGTRRVASDYNGAAMGKVVQTAFGEPISSSLPPAAASRYGYAGAWGYETDNDPGFPFLHVGERWYDPQTGRFLQRDPLGIRGGLNLYSYVRNRPLARIDPSGQYDEGYEGDHHWGQRIDPARTEKEAVDRAALATTGIGLGIGLIAIKHPYTAIAFGCVTFAAWVHDYAARSSAGLYDEETPSPRRKERPVPPEPPPGPGPNSDLISGTWGLTPYNPN